MIPNKRNFIYIWTHPDLKDLRVADDSDMPRLGEPVLSSITLLIKLLSKDNKDNSKIKDKLRWIFRKWEGVVGTG